MRRLIPAGLVLALMAALLFVVGAASAPAPSACVYPTGTITQAKTLAYNDCRFDELDSRIDQLQPAPSPTPTVTATPTPTPTETTTATPTPTPTTTPAGCVKPDASNTGATGTLTNYTGSTFITTPGTVIEDKTINDGITIAAANVTIRNSRVTGRILIYPGGNDALLTRVNAEGGVAVSSAHRAVIEKSNLRNTSGEDTMHVTSDQGIHIDGVTIRENWIHDPLVPQGAHYDGLQVRGADNVLVECNSFDLGAYQDGYNAPVFFEHANGGHANGRVLNNWLLGGAFNVMLSGTPIALEHNKVGGDYKWGLCLADGSKPVEDGNTLNGEPVTVCP